MNLELEIILVEDEEDLRYVFTEILTSWGHRVQALGDGQAALRIIDAGRSFDLLMTDRDLPGGVFGEAVVRAAKLKRPGAKAIMVTGNHPEAIRSVVFAAGVDRLLTKPVRGEDLRQTIAELFGGGR